MKLFKSLSVILTAAILLFTGCKGGSAKDNIVHKWKLTDISGAETASMPEAEKKAMLDKLMVEFTKDGKCIMSGEGDTPKTGTYTLSDDGKTLTMKQDGSEKGDVMSVGELSSSKLVFTDKDTTTMTFSAK